MSKVLGKHKSNFPSFLTPPGVISLSPFRCSRNRFYGPFKPPSSQGNKYIKVVTDYFSKYVEVKALPDQTAVTTADAFLDMVIRQHGTPKTIVSDGGVNFTSKIFRHLCKTLGIKQKFQLITIRLQMEKPNVSTAPCQCC